MKTLAIILALAMALGIIGCAGTQTTTPPECQNSWIYKTDFLPTGPIVIRTGVAFFLAAQPQYATAIRAGCITAWKALATGNLAQAMTALMNALRLPGADRYVAPATVLLASLAEAGMVNGSPVQLDACDKNVLMSLVKNIGLDAGAKLEDFQ